jgi:hypothetical protein
VTSADSVYSSYRNGKLQNDVCLTENDDKETDRGRGGGGDPSEPEQIEKKLNVLNTTNDFVCCKNGNLPRQMCCSNITIFINFLNILLSQNDQIF